MLNANATVLTKEAFLASTDIKVQAVELPELRVRPSDPMPIMHVKVMSGRELESYITATRPSGEFVFDNARAKLLVRTLCDAQGKRLFTDDDVEAVGGKSTVVLDHLAEAARQLNGISPKAVEDEAKNS